MCYHSLTLTFANDAIGVRCLGSVTFEPHAAASRSHDVIFFPPQVKVDDFDEKWPFLYRLAIHEFYSNGT
jgi:hypothetical protein